MQTRFHPKFADDPRAREIESILRSCVHCGFCNATCPTYLQLGDERDGPRGRIYLVKQLLESGSASGKTQRHLDRCLHCRSCETTCPSGVRYGRLADLGRGLLEEQVRRPFRERVLRRALRLIVPHRRRFGPLLKLGQAMRHFMPSSIKARIPTPQKTGAIPAGDHKRKMLILGGCVQASATPRTNASAIRVLDKLGITALDEPRAGCCGALSYHLLDHDQTRRFIRRNIDAWRPAMQAGAEGIIVTSSGCGVMLKEYGYIMRDDPRYAEDAQAVSNLTLDLCEVLAKENLSTIALADQAKTALHCPCTLTHGSRQSETLRAVLTRLGVRMTATRENHICCGSAGTYSIIQPNMSNQLLERKIQALSEDQPDRIVTANIGCQLHLASKADVPVSHWIELLDP